MNLEQKVSLAVIGLLLVILAAVTSYRIREQWVTVPMELAEAPLTVAEQARQDAERTRASEAELAATAALARRGRLPVARDQQSSAGEFVVEHTPFAHDTRPQSTLQTTTSVPTALGPNRPAAQATIAAGPMPVVETPPTATFPTLAIPTPPESLLATQAVAPDTGVEPSAASPMQEVPAVPLPAHEFVVQTVAPTPLAEEPHLLPTVPTNTAGLAPPRALVADLPTAVAPALPAAVPTSTPLLTAGDRYLTPQPQTPPVPPVMPSTPEAPIARPSDQLPIPTAKQLEERYPDLSPKPGSTTAPQRNDGPEQPSSPPHRLTSPHDTRIYRVRPGDTLFDIARQELGQSSRWYEIYELNRGKLGDDFDHVTPGTELIVPTNRTTVSSPRAPLTTQGTSPNRR